MSRSSGETFGDGEADQLRSAEVVPNLRCKYCGSEAVRVGTHRQDPKEKPLTWWEVPFGILVWSAGFLGLAALLYWLYLVPQGTSRQGRSSPDLLVLLGSIMVAWVVAGLHMVSVVVDRRGGGGRRPKWSRDEYLAAARARRAVRLGRKAPGASGLDAEAPGAARPEGANDQDAFFVRIPAVRGLPGSEGSARRLGRRHRGPVLKRYLWCSACGRLQSSWDAGSGPESRAD